MLLKNIITSKKTRLCVSLDVTTTEQLLLLADQLGPFVCMVKTHIDIISDFSWQTVENLKALSQKHQFLIFEDRKFADIGKTVKQQCAGGVYQIAKWADLINAHPISGEGIISGLQEACRDYKAKLLLIAELSSAGNLINPAYTQACVEMAQKHSDFVAGFISQKRLVDSDQFWHLTPGVNLEIKAGALGQQYRRPEQALVRDRCDVMIVGAGIYESKNPVQKAKEYQSQSFC